MKYKHEFNTINDHWSKCVKCGLILYYHGWSLKQIVQAFVRENEHISHEGYYRSSYCLITEQYASSNDSVAVYAQNMPSGHIFWSDGKHTYRINPITGKKLDKVYCMFSGTDKMVQDILK